MSSCRQSTRSAEQRWPAESNAEVSASSTSCSGSAEESATRAFCPPVSAISTGGLPSALSRLASCRLIERATSVEPVNTTPATAGLPTSRSPTLPSPAATAAPPRGTPASWNSRPQGAAISAFPRPACVRRCQRPARRARRCSCCLGDGKVGERLVGNPAGGRAWCSPLDEVARSINRQLAKRLSADGRPPVLIAETGGQNALVRGLLGAARTARARRAHLGVRFGGPSAARRCACSACRTTSPTA